MKLKLQLRLKISRVKDFIEKSLINYSLELTPDPKDFIKLYKFLKTNKLFNIHTDYFIDDYYDQSECDVCVSLFGIIIQNLHIEMFYNIFIFLWYEENEFNFNYVELSDYNYSLEKYIFEWLYYKYDEGMQRCIDYPVSYEEVDRIVKDEIIIGFYNVIKLLLRSGYFNVEVEIDEIDLNEHDFYKYQI